MTDKDVKTLILAWDKRCGGTNSVSDLILLRDCLCAALSAEKAGEVVLDEGQLNVHYTRNCNKMYSCCDKKFNSLQKPNHGKLIFHPTESK